MFSVKSERLTLSASAKDSMVIATVSWGGDLVQLVDAGESELQMASGLADVESLNGAPLGLDALSAFPSSSSTTSASCEEHEAPVVVPSLRRRALALSARGRDVRASTPFTGLDANASLPDSAVDANCDELSSRLIVLADAVAVPFEPVR